MLLSIKYDNYYKIIMATQRLRQFYLFIIYICYSELYKLFINIKNKKYSFS